MSSKLTRAQRRQIQSTNDGIENVKASLGVNSSKLLSSSTYVPSPISQNRQLLENMYRGSWLIGRVVDAVAEDMTREGIDIESKLDPSLIKKIHKTFGKLRIWQSITDMVRWSRLYGGAVGVIMIEGQDPETPLRLDTIGQKAFRGIYAMDRWMVDPSLSELISTPGPNIGKPVSYRVVASAPAYANQKIHNSRIIRLEGITLPYWQQQTTNGWGMSVAERLYDRLLAFDSTTTGVAQLVFKAYLRSVKVKDLRKILAAGGPGELALTKMFEKIRDFQTNEGLTILDSEDEMITQTYTFSGLGDVLKQFAEQVSGAAEIPLVRLFGQTPSGLNSTGESDIRAYYDKIKQQQEDQLRDPIELIVSLVAASEGIDASDIDIEFSSLWQMDEVQKSQIAVNTTNAVLAAVGQGIVRKETALKELRESAPVTGIWSNISDAELLDAKIEDNMPPPPPVVPGEGDDTDKNDEEKNDLPQGLGMLQ